MISLLFSIIFSSLIYVAFKLIDLKGANTFEAIVFNYIVATLFGFAFIFVSNENIDLTTIRAVHTDWLWVAIVEGGLFIAVFMAMALTTQRLSVSSASVASKMSMVIPIAVFMIINQNDVASYQKIIGIILAVLAVFLTTNRKDSKWDNRFWYLPLFVFLGSGTIDLLLGYAEQEYLHTDLEQQLFIPSIFGITACLGMIILASKYLTKKISFNWKSLVGGVGLGIVNYGSLYFIIKALAEEQFVRSQVFSISNMGIIALSSILAIIFFKEKFSTTNIIGLFLGFIAIAIILVS